MRSTRRKRKSRRRRRDGNDNSNNWVRGRRAGRATTHPNKGPTALDVTTIRSIFIKILYKNKYRFY